MAKLVAQSGPTAGGEFLLVKELTVMGRQSTADVQIIDNMASRAHCQVRRDGRLFSLVDLGSRNGTELNGKKVKERLLSFGDRIRVGEVEFLFVREPGDVELADLVVKYELYEKLGEGGMGIVYKAQQRSMAREVALKILSPKYGQKSKWVDQFIGEARAAGKLNHQNIIQVHDVGTENDIHFFSMEYVDGPTCMQMLSGHGQLEVEPALEITRQVARALDYAHAHRLIHQDIKPDNIMVGSNEVVKLADLGISKTFDEVAAEDGPKKIMGTPHYMAPESALGKKVDHRVDLYSLGATLFHLLSGKTVYHASTPSEILKAHVMEPIPSLKALNPLVQQEVVNLVEKLLAKNPDERYQSAKEIETEIDRILAGKGFSKDRAGSETVMLRRYAQGVKPGSVDAIDFTPEESGEVNLPAAKSRLPQVGGALALVAALVAVSVMALRSSPVDTVNEPAVASTQEVATSTSPGVAPAIVIGPDLNKVSGQLNDLDRELGHPADQLKFPELGQMLADIPTSGLSEQLLARRSSLAERIETLVQRHQVEQVQEAFGAVYAEADKLVDEHNFDLAAQRLDAFKGKNDPAVKERFAEVLSGVEKAKADYVAWLGEQVKLLASHKDLAALKALREGLPPAWLNTPQEQEVARAIQAVESERINATNLVATQAGKFLAGWNFSSLNALSQTQRKTIAGTPAAAKIDGYNEAAKRLAELTVVLGHKLESLQGVRFHGVLAGFTDPDLIGANLENGLELKDASGGVVYLRWSKISAKDLQAIAILALKAEAQSYQAAISQLEAAGK
jgi:serine/threonine protein kinase